MQFSRIKANASVLYLTIALTAQCAQGANPVINLPQPTVPDNVMTQFAQISMTSPNLVISVENSNVSIKHVADSEPIIATCNCPEHWRATGNTVKQVAFSDGQKGVSIRADSSGGQISLNGKIYQLPTGSNGVLHNIKVENGIVTINGQRIDPLTGSNTLTNCVGKDSLEILVPDSYTGGLQLSCQEKSQVSLDHWNSGDVILSMNGQSSIAAGDLMKLNKLVIDVQGGTAKIKGLQTKTLVANINGSGAVEIHNGSADMSNATISGAGIIKLQGKYLNLKKSVNGTGLIQVTN